VVVVTWAGVAIGVFAWWRRRVDAAIHAVDAASDDLAVFAHVLAVIEGSTASAPRLAALGARLRWDGRPPSALLAALQRHVSLLNQCEHNPYARVVSTPLLARAQLAVAIDRWHAAHRTALADWLAVVGEFEALVALATYAYEHPDDPFPSVVSDGPRFEARDLAHPLLPGTGGVANDVRIGGDDPHLLIVSGSNMSGKSTMLRAVGVNTVLALAGAPVRASSLTLSPLAIGATITVDDSLQAGHSRFYTEVLRLKAIVDLARREPVLFLLDEILHGTNSHDRRVGAEAILRTLVGTGAIGLVTTHDLALTSLAASLGPAAANVHFQDHIEDGRMVFDYQMRPGVVEHSNALALMRAVGLDV
jgi:DNA mismatch repair ATPase MutS